VTVALVVAAAADCVLMLILFKHVGFLIWLSNQARWLSDWLSI